jgi:glycosyltransferase involved in cell wall biosynthesis
VRIVAVQTGLSPYSVLGGTITDREFLGRLADRGVEVHILAEAGEPIVEHQGFVHHYWRRRSRVSDVPYVANVDVAVDLRRLLKQLAPVDWVRFNSPYSVGLGTVLSGRGHRIWGSYLHCEGDDYPFRKWTDKWLPRFCTLVTCLSEDTRSDLLSRCRRLDRSHTAVLPVGIDTARLDKAKGSRERLRQQLGLAGAEIVVLYVGSLIPRKGIGDLVQAWKLLGPRPDIRLLVVGRPRSAPEGSLISTLVEADPRVTHVDLVPYEQMPEYFHASDIFLFPTHLEGQGIAVCEAMACALPVVTTRAKGVREVVVENETALVANVGDAGQLAGHLKRLIGDSDLRGALGMRGRNRVREIYDWERIMDSLMALLEAGSEEDRIASPTMVSSSR